MTKRVGVIFAGCGWLDGAEVHEAVSVLLALDRRGAEVINFAPDIEQRDVIDHQAESPTEGSRNVLAETARITRGNVADVGSANATDLDALIIPGGFGAAKNLCSFAVDGPNMTVDPNVAQLVRDMHAAKKPIGFICIAPVIGAKLLGPDYGVELTIGSDEGTAAAIESFGARHVNTVPGEIHLDEPNNIVSTPAYMLGPNITQVYDGIDKLVETVLKRS